MKFPTISLAILALASCAKDVVIKEVTPTHQGFIQQAADAPGSLEYYVEGAATAWRKLEAAPSDSVALGDYNFAVSRLCSLLQTRKLKPWKTPLQAGSRTLSWKADRRSDWNPDLYDLVPADQLDIRGKWVDVRETKAGLGAPLVARRLADQAHEYAPTPHFFYSATAVLHFEGSRAVLAFEDPLESETVKAAGHTFPLAADYTAPLAMMLQEMETEDLNFPRLLHPAEFADTTKLARLETYDPNKTVILFVHGLMSSPATWFPLMNHLRADPEIRANYQFWFFSYPSGYPYPYSAALLRKELDAAEKRFPLRHKMVVIGHSMGGCVSRLLVTDSGMKIWNAMYTVPPEKMDIRPEHKHVLTESAIFEHRPEIGRVIFISSPHRGSDFATSWIGRLGTRLVKLPSDMLNIGSEEARYERHEPGVLELARFPDSVDTLAPNNAFVLALKELPIAPGIPYHTIAGDRGKGDSPNSTDGVVPYWSSHLPNAHSQKIVPSHHGAHQNDEGIVEVRRILDQNLKKQ